jgi:hypothetical protein
VTRAFQSRLSLLQSSYRRGRCVNQQGSVWRSPQLDQRGVISGLCSEAFWTSDFNDIIIIRLQNWKIWLGHWIAGERQDVLASLLECGVAKVVLLSLWVHIILSVDLSRGSQNWDMYSNLFFVLTVSFKIWFPMAVRQCSFYAPWLQSKHKRFGLPEWNKEIEGKRIPFEWVEYASPHFWGVWTNRIWMLSSWKETDSDCRNRITEGWKKCNCKNT